ncbi:hypothetical protein IW262DRAFT_1369015 [Armillaria fumosa]|nr:hypothetical protein IW262DRAFT_1369015 [Armillaria fumosa]
MSEGNSSPDPWHTAFPQPQAAVEMRRALSAEDLHSLLDDAKLNQILMDIDVRRTDSEGASNLPAHSFYPTLQYFNR